MYFDEEDDYSGYDNIKYYYDEKRIKKDCMNYANPKK